MNIFKILANGEGRINETNVSAFLGYLLDPTANHSLGYEFLRRFLENVDGLSEDEFNCEKFDYQIFFEQGFSKEEKKQKVDIVIVCFYTETGEGSEAKVKNFVNNSKIIKKVFLIENKINSGSFTKGQLQNQFESYKNEFKNIEGTISPEIYSIYLTPKEGGEDGKFEAEFEAVKVDNSTHIYWKDDESNTSIKNILIDIIRNEADVEIEALNEYTRHTLKSFIQFIETDFKSEKAIEKARKSDRVYTEKHENLNVTKGIEEKLSVVKNKLLEKLPKIQIGKPNLSRPKNPELSIFVGDIMIAINAGFSSRIRVNLSYRVSPRAENSKVRLEQLANTMNLKLSIPKSKTMSYCKTVEMAKKIPIDSYDEINLAVEKAIENIENVFNKTVPQIN